MDLIEQAGLAQRGRTLKSRWDRVGRELASLVADQRRVEELGPGARRLLQAGRRALGELRAGVRDVERRAPGPARASLSDLSALLEETERLLQDVEGRLPPEG
ncbi:hypothetical protein [Limnochorda pilosa]|uniref:Uncharacterized protein n=1 Tax=Limnochorda pilosa TaxID=1555112 RepID=A0A0K2SMB5_LIMPI|nr:hypothetical protein [Limnochorda pilosa]BAS28245.1 hypothetical protein LIP_2404 [Limnochorda pilosa]